MGKIAMKAVQQQVYNLNGSGEKTLAYVLRPTRYSTIESKQIVEYCAQNSMVPKAYISGAMVALAQCITNFLLNGHHVVFPELGTFSLTSTGYATGDVDKAGLDQLKKLNVRFQPCTDLKTEVENVDVELEGVYDIAGETTIAEATDTTPAKTKKYYKRVVGTTTVTADSDGNTDQKYTLSLASNPTEGGTVTGGGSYTAGHTATISATANSGYTFSKWSDENTSATRTVTVDADQTLTAIFTKNASSEGGASSAGSGGDEEGVGQVS